MEELFESENTEENIDVPTVLTDEDGYFIPW